MSQSSQENLSLSEKAKFIQEATEEINKYLDKEYHKVKLILDENSTPAELDFTLTVGIQNAYLG